MNADDCTLYEYLPYFRYPRDFWALPRCGGYGGGELTGEASVRAFLKDVRADARRGEFNGGTLQQVVFGMADSLAACTDEAERDSVRGQVVGFFATLEERIQPLTLKLHELDAVSWEELRRDVEAGLAIRVDDDAAYAAERARRVRSEAARRGWQRRRKAA